METALPIITVRALSHTYGAGELARRVLKEVSTEFQRGEITIIMGPSGAGKTTFLTLLSGLRSVQSGSVKFCDRELCGMSRSGLVEIRRRIGFIFQAQNLLDALTILENVQMGLVGEEGETAAGSKEKARRLLEEVGLGDHLHKLPRQLSGGQRQRAAIARALVRSPEVIMADEPTAALDSRTGRDVVALLHDLARKQGCAILLVTHDNRILDIADRIIRIEDGVMEETHLRMERLTDEFVKLIEVLQRYPAVFSEPGGNMLGVLRRSFHEIAASLAPKAAELAEGRMSSSLEQRAAAVQGQLHALVSLESTLAATGACLGVAAIRSLPDLTDIFGQTLEFLLMTAADALRSRTIDNVSTLRDLTGDRGRIMEQLYERFLEQQPGLSGETKQAFFDLTTAFSRNVYFMHQLALALSGAYSDKAA